MHELRISFIFSTQTDKILLNFTNFIFADELVLIVRNELPLLHCITMFVAASKDNCISIVLNSRYRDDSRATLE